MDSINILFAVVFPLACGSAIALTLGATTSLEFLIAKLLFALSWLSLMASIVIWYKANSSKPGRYPRRRYVVWGSWGLAFVSLVVCIKWTNSRQRSSSESSVATDGARLFVEAEMPRINSDGKFIFPVSVVNQGKLAVIGWQQLMDNFAAPAVLAPAAEDEMVARHERAFEPQHEAIKPYYHGNTLDVGEAFSVTNPKFSITATQMEQVKHDGGVIYTLFVIEYVDELSFSEGMSYYQIRCARFVVKDSVYRPCYGHNFRELRKIGQKLAKQA